MKHLELHKPNVGIKHGTTTPYPTKLVLMCSVWALTNSCALFNDVPLHSGPACY